MVQYEHMIPEPNVFRHSWGAIHVALTLPKFTLSNLSQVHNAYTPIVTVSPSFVIW